MEDAILSENDLTRYSRQIMVPDFGEEGQRKLKRAHAVVAGVGGLGSPASIYLACAGVGHVTLIDCDFVELSNLNRQILHYEDDIGEKKTVSAARKLTRLNPQVEVTPLFERITEDNAKELIKGVDVVVDGLDSFESRLTLNSACVNMRIPFIHGGIWGLLGQVTTIIPGKTPCLSCITPELPEKKMTFPAFGVTPAVIGSLEATEAIKLLSDFGDLLAGKALYFNGENMSVSLVEITRRTDCEICGKEVIT
ncbi:MAG: HesA/MoeB/ThiF family protein [Dehalococcoidia bacterium]